MTIYRGLDYNSSVLDPSSRRPIVQTIPDTILGVSLIKDDESYYLDEVLAPNLLFVVG